MIGSENGANNTVFIGDLSFFCTKQDLEDLFAPFGRIVKIRIKQNEGKKKSLSFGFIEFFSNQDACAAMEELDGQLFLGRALRLGWAADSSNKLRKAPISSMELKSAQILVSFISKQVKLLVTEETLRDICSPYGYVIDATIKRSKLDKNSSTQSGYGFVDFSNSVDGINGALTAILQLRDCSIDDIQYDCGLSDSLKRYFHGIRCDDAFSDSAIDRELLELVTAGCEVSADPNPIGSLDSCVDQWSKYTQSTNSDVPGCPPPPAYAIHPGLQSRYNTFSSSSVGHIVPPSKYFVYCHPSDATPTTAADPHQPSSSRYMTYLPSVDASFAPPIAHQPPFGSTVADQQMFTYGYNSAGNPSQQQPRRAAMQHNNHPVQFIPSQQPLHYRPYDAAPSHPLNNNTKQPFNHNRRNHNGR